MLSGGFMMPGARVSLLIADDEPSIRRAFSEIFTEFGYSVRSAEDGFTALVAIGLETPDILLSDLNMPGISGFEMLSVVRGCFPAIQVIAMSGDFSGVGIPPGVCADAFYEKGCSLDYLLQVVEGMAHKKGPSSLQLPSTPAWIPTNGDDSSGDAYITLSCPECLRTFSKDLDKAICPRHETGCVYCYSFDSLRNRPRDLVPSQIFRGARRVDHHALESAQSQLVNVIRKRCPDAQDS
jgi:CheY-like chemotaxis protein